ncbi:XdhC family protein [candidate division KSB1 bacterium]
MGWVAVLASIIKTRGSTPAGVLSRMLVREDGSISGTVGGGLVESQVISDSRQVFESSRKYVNRYEMTHDGIEPGMVCGGSADIFIEPLRKEYMPVFQTISENNKLGRDSILATVFESGSSVLKSLLENKDESERIIALIRDRHEFEKAVEEVISSNKPSLTMIGSFEVLIQPVESLSNVIIYGAGHVSQALAELAKRAGFFVTVADDRKEFAVKRLFPYADSVVCTPFSDAFSQIQVTEKSFIVIVTRGHAHDEEILGQALKKEAAYIGMIGSKRKVKTVYKKFVEQGVDPDKLKSLYAPIGLDIGSLTVDEIAVSIVAELIKVKRLRHGRAVRHLKDSVKTFFGK